MKRVSSFLFLLFLPVLLLGCGQTPKSDQDKSPTTNANQVKNNMVSIETNMGTIKLELFGQDAPQTVRNFITLARQGFYDGTKFHRVIPDFMIQGGDPNSKDNDWSNDGQGGPGYAFADEINSHKLVRGVLAMANAGPNTNGSQFFIVTAVATPWLDGHHTVFGQVTEGLEIVDAISKVQANEVNHPLQDVVVQKVVVSDGDYQ